MQIHGPSSTIGPEQISARLNPGAPDEHPFATVEMGDVTFYAESTSDCDAAIAAWCTAKDLLAAAQQPEPAPVCKCPEPDMCEHAYLSHKPGCECWDCKAAREEEGAYPASTCEQFTVSADNPGRCETCNWSRKAHESPAQADALKARAGA